MQRCWQWKEKHEASTFFRTIMRIRWATVVWIERVMNTNLLVIILPINICIIFFLFIFFSLLLIFLHSFLWNYCVMLLSSSWCYSLLLYSFYIYCLFMIPTDFVLYDLHHPHYYYYYLFVSCFVGNVRTTSYYVSFCWYYLDQYRHHHDLHLE